MNKLQFRLIGIFDEIYEGLLLAGLLAWAAFLAYLVCPAGQYGLGCLAFIGVVASHCYIYEAGRASVRRESKAREEFETAAVLMELEGKMHELRLRIDAKLARMKLPSEFGP